MTTTNAQWAPFQAIGIVGCGLIGCSIAAALKKRGFLGRIVGCGRPGANLSCALAQGFVDVAETDPVKAGNSCNLIVVCTPVDRIVDDVRAVASGSHDGTLITDAGSVKQAICRPLSAGLPSGVAFIGSHPIAGSEKQGCAHANADLFLNHVCVLTPDSSSSRRQVEQLAVFWQSLGMTVVEMSPDVHDRALAQTSHVPHVVAAALAATLSSENFRLTGGGFLDTTRIAGGDPKLWTAILAANAKDVVAGLHDVSDRLDKFITALENGDENALGMLLRFAKQNRDCAAGAPALPSGVQSSSRPIDSAENS